jgi:hypothetical protein
MPTATLTSRLTTNGLQQHLHAEASVVQEDHRCPPPGGQCGCSGSHCFFDSACCPGYLCETFNCRHI